jgi:serine/threonine protein kinase
VSFSVGQIVGDYRVLDVIGAGGMGAVYKAQHLISDRVEAIKVVLPNLADSGELADRFVREIRVQARLSHPNIASLLNAVRVENQLLMVMEFVDGITLSARLQHGKIAADITLQVASQILGALGYAHAQGVTHRDVKPANVMIARGGLVKLMDFGIARSSAETMITSTGAALGSIYYMSPEQVRSDAVDGRSDLYSMGILLYEMLSGVRPIQGATAWEVMNAHINRAPVPLSTLEPSLPPLLSAMVMRAVEKEPARRFQRAEEFAEHLQDVRRQLATSLVEPAVPVGTLIRSPLSASPLVSSPDAAENAKSTLAEEQVVSKTPTPGLGTSVFPREDLDLVKRHLAVHIGPVARIVVDRAAKKARSLQQLFDIVAAEIPAGKERQDFLAKRQM